MTFSKMLRVGCVIGAIFSGTVVRAQSIDAAVEVLVGITAIGAKSKVAIEEGVAAIGADEKWEVVGVCSKNTPTLKVAIVTGVEAIGVRFKVEIVEGVSAIGADRKICITNARTLDIDTLKALKLVKD